MNESQVFTEDLGLVPNKARRIKQDEFFRALFGPYYADGHVGYVEIRLIGKNKVRNYFFRGLENLKKKCFASERAHTYYGLLPREKREGGKDSVRWLTVLWADLDEKNFLKGKEAARQVLTGFPRPPSVVVDSGHGLQALWLLHEPLEITGPEEIECYLRGLAKALNGDPSVCELARVFRLPGSFNVKEAAHPIRVKTEIFNPHTRYRLADFDAWKTPVARSAENASGIRPENAAGLENVLACKFVRYAATHAKDLPEPLWWSLLTNVLPFHGGRKKAHEISSPYLKGRNVYTFEETERKIVHILSTAPGPHTCKKIAEHGYPCSNIGVCSVDAPAGLAWVDSQFVEQLRGESCELES